MNREMLCESSIVRRGSRSQDMGVGFDLRRCFDKFVGFLVTGTVSIISAGLKLPCHLNPALAAACVVRYPRC